MTNFVSNFFFFVCFFAQGESKVKQKASSRKKELYGMVYKDYGMNNNNNNNNAVDRYSVVALVPYHTIQYQVPLPLKLFGLSLWLVLDIGIGGKVWYVSIETGRAEDNEDMVW